MNRVWIILIGEVVEGEKGETILAVYHTKSHLDREMKALKKDPKNVEFYFRAVTFEVEKDEKK